MRAVVSISMPAKKSEELKSAAKKANKSLSAYVLDMYEMMQGLISEDQLLKIGEETEAEYKSGKAKKLRSLADLMKKTDDHQ